MRRPGGLAHRFIQYGGGIAISTISLAELYAGAYKRSPPTRILSLISALLRDLTVLDFDAACAEEFGRLRRPMLQREVVMTTAVLMIASVALVHNLTLVTHNTADFQNVPGLRLDDWVVP